MTYDEYLSIPPYSLDKNEKEKLLTERLVELTSLHQEKCPEYMKMLEAVDFDSKKVASYKELPFLPVRLFKEMELKSVTQDDVVKTMTSSGTTGQAVSKIYLDRTTSANQQKTMVKIVSDFTGSSRMPMIIIDCPSVVKNRAMFSARGAGILGFSIFGSKKIYVLDDDMKLDVDGLRDFLDTYKDQKILLFGFTYMIWQHFYKELNRLKDEGITFDLSNGILIHGGGWKKLISEAVSHDEFHDRLETVCGLHDIHDYYGMVEQTGCIYMECECGHLHASNFSDVIIRRPIDFSVADIGEKGIIQVVSTIPESYPGHSLLTEDEGVILGEDDCPCGRKGKYFSVLGRIKNAEIRGCSDTFAANYDKSNNGDNENDNSGIDMLRGVDFLIGNDSVVEHMPCCSPMEPFCDDIIDFCDAVSKELMKFKDAKAFTDVITLGFWLRKASIKQLKERFHSGKVRVGRGTVFHIAPSNVPVNYAYSLFTGLLCGNANIVRVPSKPFPQINIINSCIQEVLCQEKYASFSSYIALARYERNKKINDYLSSICDARVIWGGDNTISEIRKSPIGPRTTEVAFADRYSLAVIDSDRYLKIISEENESALDGVLRDFYNDTYLSDQNACTSPRVVVWTGNNMQEAQEDFWGRLFVLVRNKYTFQTIQGVDKLTNQFLVASSYDDKAKISGKYDNRLVRVKVSKLRSELMEFRGNSGFFFEYDCDDIMLLKDFCNNAHCQTVGFLGEVEPIRLLIQSGMKGVDRVVPIGHTMDFDLIWDGYDLPSILTRTIEIR